MKGVVTVRVLDRNMEQKVYCTTTFDWAGLLDGIDPQSAGYIQVGTGWTGPQDPPYTGCTSPAGSMGALDGGYPMGEKAWSNGDTTMSIIYQATFPPGAVNDGSTEVLVNEACLLNITNDVEHCVAYARIEPAITVWNTDIMRVRWELPVRRDMAGNRGMNRLPVLRCVDV